MNSKTMFVVTAILDLLLGLVLILAPGPATGLLGLQLGPVGQSLLRLLGCALLTLGMLVFQLRKVEDASVVRALVRSLFTGSLIATLLALIGEIFMLLNPAMVAMIESKVGPMPKGGMLVVVLVVLVLMTAWYGFVFFKGRKASTLKTNRQPA